MQCTCMVTVVRCSVAGQGGVVVLKYVDYKHTTTVYNRQKKC